jgi:hypothetical protein
MGCVGAEVLRHMSLCPEGWGCKNHTLHIRVGEKQTSSHLHPTLEPQRKEDSTCAHMLIGNTENLKKEV